MADRNISEYGVIGDMHSAALVSGDGSLDWLCFPRFDSPSVFAAVIDDVNGGYFRIRPAGEFRHDHSYLPESNVLVASFQTDGGSASLTDFMPVAEEITQCAHEVVRIGRRQSGSVEVGLDFRPRLGYGRLGRTQAFWRFVAHDWRYMGRWEELVKRSMLALHLLLYVPTGAICAAVTTSLPEQVGGERNWDYRFCWLRDAAFTLDVFNRLSHTGYPRPFIEWLADQALGLGQG